MKQYKLLRDWPDGMIGDIYRWNGQGYSNTNRTAMVISKKYVEEYCTWFERLPERIEVEFTNHSLSSNHVTFLIHRGTLTEEKAPAIKKAIEQVLNGDDGGWTKNYGIMFPKEATQLYTEKQLLDAEEAAWKASRKLSGHDYHHIPYDFRTFSDYKNTKK